MKKLLLIVALSTLFAACSPDEYDHFSNIIGTVLDNDDQSPIAGAKVIITSSGNRGVGDIRTDSNGKFQFMELEVDSYTIVVDKEGYRTDNQKVITTAGKTENIVFYLKKF